MGHRIVRHWAWLGLVLWLGGCATVDYVGKSYPPTTRVDLYMAPSDVQRPYEVIGEARAQVGDVLFGGPGEELQAKLLIEARAHGADGIILGQLDTRQVGQTQETNAQATTKTKGNKKTTQYTDTSTTTVHEMNELRGTLIRYTR
jgi:hypothetical protein